MLMATVATKSTLVLYLLLSTILVQAQAQPLRFTNQQHFGVEEGLPLGFISGIAQDADGFLWLSTLDGLSRYDGRNFKNFRYKFGDTTGLSANAINFLLPQADNTLTLIYDGFVVDAFDMRTTRTKKLRMADTLYNLPGAIWKLHNLNNNFNGKQWLFLQEKYNGIGWMEMETGHIAYASKANGKLQQDSLSAFLQAPDGRLYLVSSDGVQVSDAAKKTFTFLSFPTTLPKMTLPADNTGLLATRSMALLSNSSVAIYDANRIVVLDLSKKEARSYPIPISMRNSLQQGDAVLKTDSNGRLYFKHAGRIFRLTSQGRMELLWENNVAPHLHITAFFIDRSDVLWISVNAQGLIKVDLQVPPFQSFAYKNNFAMDILEQAGWPAAQIPQQWSVPYASYYFRQAYNVQGDLFISCNYFNLDKVYKYNGKSLSVLSPPVVGASYSALAIAPDGSVRVFEESRAAWLSWSPDGKTKIIQADKTVLKDVVMADAHFIGGYYWLSTYAHGLLQFKDQTLVAHYSGLQPNGLLHKELTEICLHPDDPSKFWIGSRGGGLILWDVTKGLQQVFTTDDGLPNNTVYCILPDSNGNLWGSTNKGIFRLNLNTYKISVFDAADGLAGNEFNRAHKFRFMDGRLAFGGLDGYTIFNPADFNQPEQVTPVPIQFTALQINNQVQDFRVKGSLVQQPLATLRSITLPHHKNYLRIEFAAMLFNQPLTTRYRYRLVGVDDDWILNGTSNLAAYAGLQPGKYVFQVAATGNNGLWSNIIKELTITIRPPFWATWWAIAIYVLVALGLLRLYFHFRDRRIHMEQQLQFEHKEAVRLREMEALKDRFFSNITHEFRTPLTLITTPLEKLSAGNLLSAEAQKLVATAQKNAHRLLGLINQFLDFSKLNSGQMRVQLSTGELRLFMTDLLQPFEEAAIAKDLQFQFETDVAGLYRFDKEKWEKIITNLVSNALKYTPSGGQVQLSLHHTEAQQVTLQVTNTGPGIPEKEQQKVFERFYQAATTSQKEGTGIGLALVKELTELMGGTLTLYSKPQQHTTFTLLLPVQKVNIQTIEPVSNQAQHPLKENKEKTQVVLIAEDNEELRHFLVESLEQHFKVVQAANGLTAWDRMLQELPDVVVSDIMMPGMDGYALCQLAKSDVRTSHIGLILLTSRAAPEARLKGLQTGADVYLTKPFQLAELELQITNLLHSQQKIREHLKTSVLTSQPQATLPHVQDIFLSQLYEELEKQIDNPQLGVDFLCQHFAMSRSTLNRKLKSLLDTSANELIRQYRLQKGAALLTTGLDITAVAYQVGFSSPSYFAQCFREQFSQSPSDFVAAQAKSRMR